MGAPDIGGAVDPRTQLQLVDGLGLSAVDMTRVITVVSNFVRGAAKVLFGLQRLLDGIEAFIDSR